MLSCLWFGSQLTVVRTEAAGFCPWRHWPNRLPLLCQSAQNLGKRALALMSPSIPGALYSLSTAKHNGQLPEQTYAPTSNIDSLLIFIVGDDGSPGNNFEGCLQLIWPLLGLLGG